MGEWVVLELSSRCEGEDPGVIQESIRRLIRGGEVFIPASVTEIGGDRVYTYLVDGYAFLRREHPDSVYLRLENSKYVQTVLTEPGGRPGACRRLSVVSEDDVEKLQRQVKSAMDQGIGVGDRVVITSGPYRNIEAAVVEDLPEQGMVQVHVELRSKQSLVMLPRGFLRVVKRAPLSPVFTRLLAFRAWSKLAIALLAWDDGNWDQIQMIYTHFSQLQEWVSSAGQLHSLIGSFHGSLEIKQAKILEKLEKIRLVSEYQQLWVFVASYYGLADQGQLDKIQEKLGRLRWLDNALRQGRDLQRSYDALRRKLGNKSGKRQYMTQNVLVDGHNLAFRCLYAPGMSRLTDDQGRPTGMILGCLRSLGALKKRYPEANLYVTWDGSSQRRKSVFGEYKANRKAHSGLDNPFDQVAYLRGILPNLGITQAFNPVEEADDVIGTLVLGDLKPQRNVIFSSDRDMLQLVTSTTSVLIPAIGSRKEILFNNPETVEESTGFPPDQMVQFRSLCGDTSDNIPGVPRVPKKVLRDLLQAHGSVDGIYKSGLAGLTKNQYDRLRSAEPQVRINIGLMTLVDVEVSLTYPDVDGKAASRLMQEVGIKPQPLLKAFGLDGE